MLAPGLAAVGTVAAPAVINTGVMAPASEHFTRVWHFGRTTGDLERIIAFYHDLLGLELRGARDQRLPFMTSAALDEFVAAPAGAQFRAVHLPIPGASDIDDPAERISLEAFEYRGIDRRQILPPLGDIGVSNIRFLVRDLDGAIVAAKAADVAFITAGASPIKVPAPLGFSGTGRAVMLRDPDGYPIELMQLQPAPPPLATAGPASGVAAPAGAAAGANADSRILGAMMVVVVSDLESALRFYTGFIGAGAQASTVSRWRANDGVEQLRGMKRVEYRSAVISLPGSALRLELLQFRGIQQHVYTPSFQDIGHAHIALYTRDLDPVLAQLRVLGGRTLSPTGTFTRFSPTLRGFYTRDRDGLFLEVIERREGNDR